MGKKNKIKGGDFIPKPGALDTQIEKGNVARRGLVGREKTKRHREQDQGEFVPGDISAKILNEARKQLVEETEGDDTTDETKRMRHISLGKDDLDSDAESDGDLSDHGFEDRVVDVDPRDEADMERFMNRNNPAASRTLFDLIQEKIEQKKTEANTALSQLDPNEGNMQMRDLDPEVVEMYREVGRVMSKYRGGKVPKAFKLIPKMVNWEQLLYLTDPDKWSAAAMYEATRVFASNLNPKMCQRFYTLVLLPRLRDDIDEYKKLNFHLYQAVFKALYKPAAFFKGVILPLCESGTCTLREAYIFGSVLAKSSIPMFHTAAAMLKIAEMEYSGANSYFLRVLIDKKYTLPYKAIDALVSHFYRFKDDKRDLPVLWHQSVLAMVQRYKNDLNDKQRHAIFELVKAQHHHLITPAIRYELEEKNNTKAPVDTRSNDAAAVISHDVKPRNDTMEF